MPKAGKIGAINKANNKKIRTSKTPIVKSLCRIDTD